MEQREVTDQHNTTWTCVQAYGGLNGKAAKKALDIAATDEGKLPVVCTPSGGAQTVRLELNKNWLTELSDEDLITAISRESGK